jgi:hypothetical protein
LEVEFLMDLVAVARFLVRAADLRARSVPLYQRSASTSPPSIHPHSKNRWAFLNKSSDFNSHNTNAVSFFYTHWCGASFALDARGRGHQDARIARLAAAPMGDCLHS